jgi:hypothetical protein
MLNSISRKRRKIESHMTRLLGKAKATLFLRFSNDVKFLAQHIPKTTTRKFRPFAT